MIVGLFPLSAHQKYCDFEGSFLAVEHSGTKPGLDLGFPNRISKRHNLGLFGIWRMYMADVSKSKNGE